MTNDFDSNIQSYNLNATEFVPRCTSIDELFATHKKTFDFPAFHNLVFLQVDLDKDYDIVQKIGEGWFSRVYLTETRETREEIVIKAINSKQPPGPPPRGGKR